MDISLLYNLLMIVLDAWAFFVLRRNPTVATVVRVGFCSAVAGMTLAFVPGMLVLGSRFTFFRLAAFGLFFHGPVLLAGFALLLRRSRRGVAVLLTLLAAGIAGGAVDAFLIEPTWLEVSHVRLASAKVDRAVRFVVLADLQTDVFGSYERRVFRRVLAEKPDVILLAGDYLMVDQETRRKLQSQISQFLREIEFSAPGGVFAVRGNVDKDDWTALFEGVPVVSVEATQSFDLDSFRLTCLALGESFDSTLELSGGDQGRFHVVLGHVPNFALGRVEADLLVAGHTHGGQVRLPLVGPLITLCDVPRSWAAGRTELPDGGTLYVSRGVGMERGSAPRIRFLCRPELVVIDVVPH